jgi:divalent metal cation (Fe/Co/Zn/Cd) transporter
VLAIALAEPLVREAHDVTIFEQDGSSSVSLHLKFPPELDLRSAHEIAERVERAIRAVPGVSDVQVHLEPLERTLAARPPDEDADGTAIREIERLVRERTGMRPQKVRLLSTDTGRVLFLTLGVEPGATLAEAHRVASELEEELRQRVPDISDVVVHTEP